MPDGDGYPVLIELERLRGAVNEGFARMDGRLDGTMQRTGQAEKDIDEVRADVKEAFRQLDILKQKMWWYSGVAATVAGGGVLGATQLWGA